MSDAAPDFPELNAAGSRFGIVAARYNRALVDRLLERCRETLRAAGVTEGDIEVVRVPGSAEIPYALNLLAETGELDCLIGLGVVVAGDTQHHRQIGDSTALALQQLALDSFLPVINGILVVEKEAQAEDRVGPKDRGAELARTAIEMAVLKLRLSERFQNREDWPPEDEEDSGSYPPFFDGDDEGETWRS